MACLLPLFISGCAGRSEHHLISGDHGAIVDAPLQHGDYSEGNSAAWLGFLLTASVNGYAQDVVTAKYVAPKAEALAARARFERSELSVLWIGHSTFLVRIGGVTILTDPVFSNAAAPLQLGGPQRYAPPALEIDELPPVDVVVVSHNHYDHLDDTSLARLARRFPLAKLILPKGNEAHGVLAGFAGTVGAIPGQAVTVAGLRLIALPAYHETSRFGIDADQTRALGYYLKAGRAGVYFAGDTAYGPLFKQIRSAYGAPDVALVPIGAYEPHKETRFVHTSPEEAMRVASDLGAKVAVGMHWGTFPLSGEPVFEPARRFLRSGRNGGPKPVVLRIGGYLDLSAYRSAANPS